MRICIHRGAKEIGGSCVELESQGKRLILDLGLPLDAESDECLLPPINGLLEQDEDLLGLAISHSHIDHCGLGFLIHPDIPIFIGESANRILAAASFFIPGVFPFKNVFHFKNGHAMDIGPFRITPYLVDHSAYDSYAFLIEAEGKSLFYSGDLRAHGRKSKLFELLLKRKFPPIDTLLLEGSSLGRIAEDKKFLTEEELEMQMTKQMTETSGMALVYASGQNIDRLVTIFRACKRTNRIFVIDLYTAEILRATGNENIPQAYWPLVKLFIPHWQRVLVKKSQRFDLLEPYKSNRVFREAFNEHPEKYTLLFRPSLIRDLDEAECLKGSKIIYSQWGGYLTKDMTEKFRAWLDRTGLEMIKIHTSGHASIPDLKRLASALGPKQVVPIHSFNPENYQHLFDNVCQHDDGEWWTP